MVSAVIPALPQKQVYSSVYALRTSDGQLLWRYKLNGGRENWSSWLAFSEGIVYTSANGEQEGGSVYALRATDGSVIWSRKVTQRATYAVITPEKIYVSSDDHVVYALRIRDGSQLWMYSLDEQTLNPPVLVGSTLYVGGTIEIVYALSAANGKEFWQRMVHS